MDTTTLTPAHKDKLKKALKVIDESMTRNDAEKDLIKGEIDAVAEETGLDKKIIRRLAKTYHKRNFPEVQAEDQDFEAIYETVVGV